MNKLELPLCVDCDGTLLHTDLLFESFLILVKRSPLSVLLVPLWLFRGKSYLKMQLAKRITIDPALLPYNTKFIEYLKEKRAIGQKVMLVTASARPLAEAIARHTNLFDAVEASDEKINLSGRRKADRLCQLFKEKGFVYAGNGPDDIEVWKRAGAAVVVNASDRIAKQVRHLTNVVAEFPAPPVTLMLYLKAMRLHQWLKNLLVFVPLIAAHQLNDVEQLVNAVLAFVSYSLCASSVYIINDLLDLPSDRAHPRKCTRAFASGSIPIQNGFALAPSLLLSSLAVASFLPVEFVIVLVVYFVSTLAYSVWLKTRIVVDVIFLGGLYTLRIIGGAAATAIIPSFWLLAFSMFIFLSLAIVKRYSELLETDKRGQLKAAGRNYTVKDLSVLMSLGTASGYNAILVLALYINDAKIIETYPNRQLLWLIFPFLLYWISRVWMKTHRGEMHDDPIVFALRDWQSKIIVGLLACIVYFASLV